MVLFHLFVRSNRLFELLKDEDYQLIQWGVMILLSASITATTYPLTEDLAIAVISGIFTLLVVFVMFVHIIPFFLKQISSWANGKATKNQLSNVLILSLLPMTPAMFLEGYASLTGNLVRSSEMAAFLLQCVSWKVLILGIARYNKFSVKNAAIVLITFWGIATLIVSIFIR